MKYLNFLTICLLCTVVTIFSCSSEDPVRKQARENLVVPETPSLPPGSTTTPPATPTAEPAQNAAGVWHYTCSNGCAGGGGAAAPCAVCGNQLAHNQAYHANNTPTATTPGMPAATATPSNTPTPPVLPKAAEPAQNAAGVWHYTCTNGCSGGGGSAGSCGSCGGALAHNKDYHNS